MIERLEIINKRYEELNKQLLDPENLSNIKLTREISKEISDLEDTVNCYKKYKKVLDDLEESKEMLKDCLLYTSPSPRDKRGSRMPSSA